MTYLGIDIGGTTVKIGLFNGDNLIKKWSLPTSLADSGKEIIPDIAASVAGEIASGLPVPVAAGIGIPGHMKKDGNHCEAVNIRWEDYPLGSECARYFPFPCHVQNDANLAALAEQWTGNAKDLSDFVLVTLGTGVGGGIVSGGHLISGSNSSAGEIGHVKVNLEETRLCNCGSSGCLEQYCSISGLIRIAEAELRGSTDESVLRSSRYQLEENGIPQLASGDDGGLLPLDPKMIFDAAKEGDVLARRVTDTYCRYLGTGLASVGNILNPEAFLLGGGISGAGEYLLAGVEKYYRKNAYPGCKDATFRLASLGNDAGIYGAARFAQLKSGN